MVVLHDEMDIAEDMALCVLDAWRMDGAAPTADELRRRYGFSAALVEAHGHAAIAAGGRLFEREKDKPVTHVAGGNGAAIPVRLGEAMSDKGLNKIRSSVLGAAIPVRVRS